jgi:hypothetical protein
MINQLDDMKCENEKKFKMDKMELVGKAKLNDNGLKKLKA